MATQFPDDPRPDLPPPAPVVTPPPLTPAPNEAMGARTKMRDGRLVLMTLAEQAAFESELALRQAALQAPQVPERVSMRQAKSALAQMGYLDQVPAAIAAIVDDAERKLVQIAWDEETTVARAGELAQRLERSFGLTAAQVDALFVLAATFPAEG